MARFTPKTTGWVATLSARWCCWLEQQIRDGYCCCALLPSGHLDACVRGTAIWLQNDDFFKQLEPLVAALRDAVPEAKYDAKQLVFLLVQLLHFQEAALGKEVSCCSCSGTCRVIQGFSPSRGGSCKDCPRQQLRCASVCSSQLGV